MAHKMITKFLVCYEKATEGMPVVKGNVIIDIHPLQFIHSYNVQGALKKIQTCMILTNFVEIEVVEGSTYNLAEF